MFPGETPLNTRVIKLLNTASESVQHPKFPWGSRLSIILSLLQLGGDILLAAPCSPPKEVGLLAVLLTNQRSAPSGVLHLSVEILGLPGLSLTPLPSASKGMEGGDGLPSPMDWWHFQG